LGTGVDGHPYK
ncbi:hypothetical protein CISIN_1g0007441mg, partial [Citrus sinensis]